MAEADDGARHSEAAEPQLVTDPAEIAQIEAANVLEQYDQVEGMVHEWTQPGRTFRLRPSMIQGLHRTALKRLSRYAGNFRPADVRIGKSRHEPVGAHLVSGLTEEMCDHVSDRWHDAAAVHLASYVLWRLNWIHPFSDGNGRTARAVSYLVLCIKSGFVLPGKETIPEQIARNKAPYYQALEHADAACREGRLDVSELETLLSTHLAAQLMSYYRSATGTGAS